MEIGTEGEPFVTEPVKDPFQIEELPEPTRRERPAPAPVERPAPQKVPEKVPA